MTTYVGGEVLTAAIMNSLDAILQAATWESGRQTFAANSTYDLGSSTVAANLVFSGSPAPAVNKFWEGISFRTITSTQLAGTGWVTAIDYLHNATVGAGAGAYGIVGTVTGTSGAGKLNGMYSRITSSGAAFTGIGVAFTGAATSVAGTAWAANSTLMNLVHDTTDLTVAFPVGIFFNTNTAGAILTTALAVDSSVDINGAVIQQVQRASSTGSFFNQYNSSSVLLSQIDYLGNLNFKASGTSLTTGQRITGDLTNATLIKRLMIQTATNNSATILGIIPKGSGTAAGIALYNDDDPDNTARLAVQSGAAAHIINSTKAGTGTTLGFGIQVDETTRLLFDANGDVQIGGAAAATGDTTGHHYMQSVAGAPTGVPTGYAGWIPFRYDSANNFLYVYNGGWKKSTAYA